MLNFSSPPLYPPARYSPAPSKRRTKQVIAPFAESVGQAGLQALGCSTYHGMLKPSCLTYNLWLKRISASLPLIVVVKSPHSNLSWACACLLREPLFFVIEPKDAEAGKKE